MQKLLYILSHASTGGMPQVSCKRIEMIRDYFDVYVVEWNDISPSFVVQKNRVKNLLKPNHFFTLGENKYQILDLINHINPDIIHFEEIPEDGSFHMDYDIAYKIYDKNRKYKIFETTHSSDFDVDNKVFFPDKFIFVSQYNSFRFAKLGVPIEVVEYPTDPIRRDRYEELREKLGMDKNKIHILNVGLFTPRKNQAYALEIARFFNDENVVFHFVGNHADNFKFYWEPLLKKVPKNCKIWNERSDVDDFYIASDVFLFTSRGFKTDKELNPLVIKEALCSGLPLALFNLDVYCGKYDNDSQVTYLTGDLVQDIRILETIIAKVRNGEYKNIYREIKCDDYNLLEDVIEEKPIDQPNKIENIEIDDINDIDGDGILAQYDHINHRILLTSNKGEKEYSFYIKNHQGTLIYNNPKIKIPNQNYLFIQFVNASSLTQDKLYLMFENDEENITKELLINENLYEDKFELNEFIINNKFINEDELKLGFIFSENKITIDYSGDYEDEIKIKVHILDNDSEVYDTTLGFKKNYSYWIIPPQYVINNINDISGFNLKFYKHINNEFIVEKSIIINNNIVPKVILGEEKKTEIQKKEERKIEKKEELIIISTYPNTIIKEDTTRECIKSLRKSGRNIMLSSHISVEKDIQDMVDYYVYDSYNPVIDHSYYRYAWFEKDNYKINIDFGHLDQVGKNQSLTVLNNLYNSAIMAKNLGYKRFYSFTYDSIINEKDIDVIENISEKINRLNKKGYLMKFKDNGMDVIKSVVFVMDVEKFLEIFENVRTPENYNNDCNKYGCQNFLEHYFYKRINNYINEFVVEEADEENLFSNSQFNLFSECEYSTVVPVKDRDDLFAIWYNNYNKDDDRKLVIDVSNEKSSEQFDMEIKTIMQFCEVFEIQPNDKYTITYSFYSGDNKYKEIKYEFDDLDEIKKNGNLEMRGPIKINKIQ